MPENCILLYKNVGETPLEAIQRFKYEHPKYAHLPMTYAGRLDPLAEGLLILLAGDECMKKDDYLALPKTYELSILFGFETDTSDLLGLVENEQKYVVPGSLAQTGEASRENFQQEIIRADGNTILSEFEIQKIISRFIGKITQTYPPYSSRPVNGKPLFWWAREGKLGEIAIPSHEVMVYDISFVEMSAISGKRLLSQIENITPLVKGDFRQEEILSLWREVLKDKENIQLPVLKIIVEAGSGTYMRMLAHDIGHALGLPALAYHIKRTKIGEHTLDMLKS